MEELRRRERELGVEPDWELDAFMKAAMRTGKRESIATDLALHYLGLDVRPLPPCLPGSFLRRLLWLRDLVTVVLRDATDCDELGLMEPSKGPCKSDRVHTQRLEQHGHACHDRAAMIATIIHA